MIVSGGKILATAKVRTDGITVSGDGLDKPIGVADWYKVEVVAATDNVEVTKKEDTENRKVEFSIGVTEKEFNAGSYIDIDETNTISVTDDLISSADAGKKAYDTIEAKKDDWSKDTTYVAGENIYITDNNEISGRDWTPELDNKANTSELDKVNARVDVIEKDVGEQNTRIENLKTSANNISAYITEHEGDWENVTYDVTTSTPDTVEIKTITDEENRKVTFELSATGKTYEAGDWVDKDKLANGTISVSGYKSLKTMSPLYFSADPVDEGTIWLLSEDSEQKRNSTAFVICNGWAGDPNSYYSNDKGITGTVPAKSLDAEYVFHFDRAMGIQINVNAKFRAKSDAVDKIGTVGFAAATIGDVKITNAIEYTMFGSQGEQYFTASTIARLDVNDFGGTFPVDGVDVTFKFLYDEDFLSEIEYPCISISELING